MKTHCAVVNEAGQSDSLSNVVGLMRLTDDGALIQTKDRERSAVTRVQDLNSVGYVFGVCLGIIEGVRLQSQRNQHLRQTFLATRDRGGAYWRRNVANIVTETAILA